MDKLIGFMVGLLLFVIFANVIINLIGLVFTIVFLALPAWSASVTATLLTLSLLIRKAVGHVADNGSLAKSSNISFMSNSIKWTINEDMLSLKNNDTVSFVISVTIGISIGVGVSILVYELGAFSDVTWTPLDKPISVSPTSIRTFSILISIACTIATFFIAKPSAKFVAVLQSTAKDVMEMINIAFANGNRLVFVQESFNSIESRFNLQVTYDPLSQIRAYCTKYSLAILKSPTLIKKFLRTLQAQSADDLQNLEACAELFAKAQDLYTRVSTQVPGFYLPKLNEIYTSLYSDNLKELLRTRQWPIFKAFISELIDAIEIIENNSASYSDGDDHTSYESKDTRQDSHNINGDLARAFKILGLAPSATKKEFQKRYHKLRGKWHTDKAHGSHDKIVEINWAVSFIKNNRPEFG